jgi:DNA-binding winged helix-turn-helix (wHTH) protein/tetratricopeptide (TPR) repeat protein
LKYEFENFQIDVPNRILRRDREEIPLQGRVFDCLICLVGHAGQLVTKNDMMGTVWAGSFVEESNLTVAISTLRRALGEEQGERKYIQTVPKRGYRFVCEVRELPTEPDLHPSNIPIELGKLASPFAPTAAFPIQTGAPALQAPSITHPASEEFLQSRFPWKPLIIVVGLLLLILGGATWRHRYLHSKMNAELPVRQMNSVLQYSSSSSNPAAIGRKEGVDAVVTGTLSTDNAKSTIRMSLLRSYDGHVLWKRDLSAPNGDTTQLQIEIESALREELGRFSGSRRPTDPSAAPLSANPEAYQLYLRGRYFWNRRTEKSLQLSIDYYKQSIQVDPKFALAYAGLADSYALQADLSVVPGDTCGPDARAAALAAIALDPQLAEPHAALGMVDFFSDWNGLEAQKEFQRAIALDPASSTAHHWYALDLAAMGKLPQALYEIRRAHTLDPLSLIIGTNVGWILYLSRDYPEAIKEYGKVLELDPNFARARTRMGIAQMQSGDLSGAIANLEAAAKISGDDPYVIGLLAQAEATAGHLNDAETLLHTLKSQPESRYVPPISRALAYIGLHEDDRALDELQQGIRDRSPALTYAKVDPSLDRLRTTPRFKAMITTMQF